MFAAALTAKPVRVAPRASLAPGHVRSRVALRAAPRPSAVRASRVAAVRVVANEDWEMIELETVEKMDKTIENTKSNFATVRTGRANPGMLGRIFVDYYGAPTPLQQLAAVTVPDASTLMIKPFDKSALVEIEKAIANSNIGITPTNDGEVVRLNIPSLTEERRKEMAKLVKSYGEDGKVAVRNIRQAAMKQVKGIEGVSEDMQKGFEDDVQKMTDDYVKQVDELVAAKSKELTQL